jgi:hypothetical protein
MCRQAVSGPLVWLTAPSVAPDRKEFGPLAPVFGFCNEI